MSGKKGSERKGYSRTAATKRKRSTRMRTICPNYRCREAVTASIFDPSLLTVAIHPPAPTVRCRHPGRDAGGPGRMKLFEHAADVQTGITHASRLAFEKYHHSHPGSSITTVSHSVVSNNFMLSVSEETL